MQSQCNDLARTPYSNVEILAQLAALACQNHLDISCGFTPSVKTTFKLNAHTLNALSYSVEKPPCRCHCTQAVYAEQNWDVLHNCAKKNRNSQTEQANLYKTCVRTYALLNTVIFHWRFLFAICEVQARCICKQ